MLTIEIIQSKIYLIRGHKVMLDRDIALLYGVKPIALRQQVKRNIDRFPDDFMLQLTVQEVDFLLSQNVIPSKQSLGGALRMHLQSKALKIEELEKKYDYQFKSIFDAIRRMMAAPAPEQEGPAPYKRHKVGYIAVKP